MSFPSSVTVQHILSGSNLCQEILSLTTFIALQITYTMTTPSQYVVDGITFKYENDGKALLKDDSSREELQRNIVQFLHDKKTEPQLNWDECIVQ